MLRSIGSVTFLALFLVGCGGGGGDSGTPPPPPATFTVGGTVTGLSGPGLVLQLGGGADLPIGASGAFTFATRMQSGASYAVTVKSSPTSPPQVCTVAGGVGTIAAKNVTNVDVTCASGYTIGGTVSGLTGSGLVLQMYLSLQWGPFHSRKYNPWGPPLHITSNGSFTFDVVYSDSLFANVKLAAIFNQPASPYQNCLIRNNEFRTLAANKTDIEVGCSQFADVANAGDNTVSAYTVDPTSGALIAVGTPVATGTLPHAIVGTEDRRFVFVANEGSNDISAFAVNFATGALTAAPGSPFPTGTNPRALSQLGSRYLYVANAGSDELSAYQIDQSTGALTPLSPGSFATGKGPSSILQLGPEFLYVANNGGSDDISAFDTDPVGTGVLYPVSGSPFPAGGNPLSLAGAGSFLYSANPDATSPSVSGFSIDFSTRVLSPLSGSPFPLPVSHNIATDNALHLYVTSDANVLGYGVDATTGALTPLPGFPVIAGANAYSITIDPSNQFLYVADDVAANVAAFRIDATGSLAPIAGSPFAAGNHPQSIATF